MARCPLVRPETVRVTLPDGEWVELAKELTAGEHRDMFVAQIKDTPMDGGVPALDYGRVGINRVLAYVKEWSYVDYKDNPLPITEDWLRKFDQTTFRNLLTAVDAHDDASEREVEARKNALAGATTS